MMLMVMLVLTLAIFSKDERTAINRTLEVSDGLSSNTMDVRGATLRSTLLLEGIRVMLGHVGGDDWLWLKLGFLYNWQFLSESTLARVACSLKPWISHRPPD